jgi:2-dehydropantoate 2-reductase
VSGERVLVIGCGAIGGIVAARLARLVPVTVLDQWAAHVDAIRRCGVRVTVRAGAEPYAVVGAVEALRDPQALRGPFTHAFVAVKGPDTRDAVLAAAPHLEGAVVLTLQNGLGNAETIAEICRAPVCQGVTMNAGEVTGPGEILQTEVGETWLGPHRASLADAASWADLLRRAGMQAEVLADPRGAVWSKLIFNAAVNPLPVLTGLRLSGVYAHPETYQLLKTLVEEGKAVAGGRGIALRTDPMDLIDAHRALGEAHAHQGSMKQDIDRGRPTEVDTILGALIAEADRAGVPVPALRTVYRLVKAAESRARAAVPAGEAR